MKVTRIIVLLIAVGLVSCQKDELPKGNTSDPAFTSVFDFNGESYSISPGEMGLIQTADFELQDSGMVFTSTVSDPSCTPCGPGFRLIIQSPPGYSFEEDDDLYAYLWDWTYSMGTQGTATALQVTATTAPFFNSGFWFLNGAPINTQPVDSVSFTVLSAGLFTLTFEDIVPSCQMVEMSAERTMVFDGENEPCYGNIFNSNSPFTYIADPGPTFNVDSILYEWTVGDTTYFTGNFNQLFAQEISNTNEICVLMTDYQGCQSEACMKVVTTPIGMVECGALINIKSVDVNTIQLADSAAMMILEFTDANGNQYSNEGYIQNDATVELLDISPYTEPTQPDVKFAKVTFGINCQLYNAEGIGFPFSGLIQTAISYP